MILGLAGQRNCKWNQKNLNSGDPQKEKFQIMIQIMVWRLRVDLLGGKTGLHVGKKETEGR